MSAAYFASDYISNSDLKRVKKYWDPSFKEPENLEEIFDLGTLIHACLLEPAIAKVILQRRLAAAVTSEERDKILDDYNLAQQMAATMKRDKLCGPLMTYHDFSAEHEFYRQSVHGVKARCKVDGRSKSLAFVLEYKGLSVSSEKAFDDAIINFDYDQGAAWYLDVTRYRRCLIAAVSKKDPRKIFKRLVDRDHPIYRTGEEKVLHSLEILKQFVG